MTAHTRSMAACLEDAERDLPAPRFAPDSISVVVAILVWQRAKACRDVRAALGITDDKTLDELEQIEHETRLAARSACEAVGIDWRTLGDVA